MYLVYVDKKKRLMSFAIYQANFRCNYHMYSTYGIKIKGKARIDETSQNFFCRNETHSHIKSFLALLCSIYSILLFY